MTKKKKLILIIVVVIVFLCLISTLCLGVAYKFFSSIVRQGNEIKSGVLHDVCQSHGVFSETEYKVWFTSGYRSSVEYFEAMGDISEAFPSDYDCDELDTSNILELFSKGHSVNISVSGGKTRATVSFPKDDDETNTFELDKVGNEWEIDKLYLTKSSG